MSNVKQCHEAAAKEIIGWVWEREMAFRVYLIILALCLCIAGVYEAVRKNDPIIALQCFALGAICESQYEKKEASDATRD